MLKTAEKTTLPQRIESVGTSIYPGHGWTARLARGLGMSRSQLFEYRSGGGKHDRDIDGEMLALIDRERDDAAARGVALAKLRHHLLALVAKARKG